MNTAHFVSSQLAKLSSGSASERMSAIRYLEPFMESEPAVYEAIVEAIKDSDEDVSERAIGALLSYGKLTVEDAVFAVSHPRESTRIRVVRWLRKSPESIDVIASALQRENDKRVVSAIATKLKEMLVYYSQTGNQRLVERIAGVMLENVEKLVRYGLREIAPWLAKLIPAPAFDCLSLMIKNSDDDWLVNALLSIPAFYGAVDDHCLMELLDWVYEHKEEARPVLMQVYGYIASAEANKSVC